MSSSLQQKESELIVVEESVGIGWQQFKEKFVFNLNSGPDPNNSDFLAIHLNINQPSPSQLQGITHKEQTICTAFMTELIFKAGQMLKLPVSTTIVTTNLAHYYFSRKSFLDTDFRDLIMGATFLACKSEQTLRRSHQVAAVFDYLFKMYQGIRPIKELSLDSNEYNYMKKTVINFEYEILFELGFQVYKLFDIPHRYISGLVSSFNKHKHCNAIIQHSWTFLNDIYRTKAPVYFPGQVIAAASVFMALQKLQIPMPDKPWWILMEASFQQIKQICILTNQMYQISNLNQVNINIVSQILEKHAKATLKVTNVLPVPYTRKIRLDVQGLVRKSIEVEKPAPIIQEKSSKQPQKDSDSENQKSRQKSKKEKKKDKKKHKDQERSKSRSPSQKPREKSIGKYQNDEETPKIKKSSPQTVTEKVKNDKIQLQKPQNEATNKIESEKNISTNQVNPSVKKSVLLDAKSMLSKLSMMQNKKSEVRSQPAPVQNEKLEQKVQKTENGHHQNGTQQVQEQPSESDEEDELLAELIQIKKKNLQKKQQNTS